LIPFVTAGFPNPQDTLSVISALEEGGADLLELGIPFSDPIADGPTIQLTSQQALRSGVSVRRILEIVRELRKTSQLPVVLMTYMNPILAYGEEEFFKDSVSAGVDGLLASDLPPEERDVYWESAERAGIDRVVLVAPTTPAERLPRLLSRASGFVYCLTRTGVTGKGKDFASNLADQVARIRQQTNLPIAAGFGVRSAKDIEALPRGLDGVVLGARLLEILMESSDLNQGRRDVTAFLKTLAPALQGSP
jgi:tryptophan synthase alpha chain